ncbi:MAG: VWA domain-containing protein [Myxococcales bacterium]|nr:VWA domain-containing protein [Myxococcales bacterium]
MKHPATDRVTPIAPHARTPNTITRPALLALFRLALVTLIVVFAACDNRFPVPASDSRADPDAAVDGPIVIPDGPSDAGCPADEIATTVHRDPRGTMTFVTRDIVKVRAIGVPGDQPLTSVLVADDGEVAAAALTAPVAEPDKISDPRDVLTQLQQRAADYFAREGIGSEALTVRGSGTSGTSADGFPDVKAAVWHINGNSRLSAWGMRSHLLAAVLAVQPHQLSNMPTAPSGVEQSESFVAKLTVVLRPGDQIAVSLAVATARAYDDVTSTVGTRVDDLGGGSALGVAGLRTERVCDVAQARGSAMADIIFVVDESGSMNDNRADIVNNANRFFAKAKAAGLDFRMGVAGMKNPSKGAVLGKFCSNISSDPQDDGGQDRFLGADEQSTFSACISNPPYFEGGAEYGLAHAYHAVKRHLPRAVNDPTKVRAGAELVLIIVTDEAPQELKQGASYNDVPGFLRYSDYRSTSCSLPFDLEAKTEAYLKPWFDLFSGRDDPQARTAVHVIGGTCKNACKAEVAYGYQALAQRFGGQVGDVCQANLGATLDLIIESIIAAASPRKLRERPVSASLIVEVNGVRIPRSRQKGVLYNVAANTLSFINVDVGQGALVVASYRRMTR